MSNKVIDDLHGFLGRRHMERINNEYEDVHKAKSVEPEKVNPRFVEIVRFFLDVPPSFTRPSGAIVGFLSNKPHKLSLRVINDLLQYMLSMHMIEVGGKVIEKSSLGNLPLRLLPNFRHGKSSVQ